MATLEAIKYRRGSLQILDQLLLPRESKYIPIKDTEDGWTAIHTMQTRGAPAIAIVGSLSLAVELENHNPSTKKELQNYVVDKMRYLVTARPTAVNMSTASKAMEMLACQLASQDNIDVFGMKNRVIDALEAMLEKDLNDNRSIGENGANHILTKNSQQPVTILTHCNTGSLATAGYGTALGVIRSLHSRNCLSHVYCTETRPYNQGSRLTAYELVYEKMPATLICDDMVAALMKSKAISAVVVGADRIAANGDTANKIGTYQLAILAKHHGVPFYIAAPWTTIDLNTENGNCIPIEERSPTEITHIMNIAIAAPENRDCIPIEERSPSEITHIMNIAIAPPGIHCWNPAFDVTPAELIEGIITEKGVFLPGELRQVNETEIVGGKGDS